MIVISVTLILQAFCYFFQFHFSFIVINYAPTITPMNTAGYKKAVLICLLSLWSLAMVVVVCVICTTQNKSVAVNETTTEEPNNQTSIVIENSDLYLQFQRANPENNYIDYMNASTACFYGWLDTRPYHAADVMLVMVINRNKCFADTCRQIANFEHREFTFKLCNYKIVFNNEMGIDVGGLTSEWLRLSLQSALAGDERLFQNDDANGYNPVYVENVCDDNLQKYCIFGMLLGEVLIRRCTIDLNLSRSMYMFLLGKKIELNDVQAFDEVYYNSLIHYRNYFEAHPCEVDRHTGKVKVHTCGDEDEYEELNFRDVEQDYRGYRHRIELLDVDVNKNNISEYIDLQIDARYVGRYYEQLTAIKSGFNYMIPDEALLGVEVDDFILMLEGTDSIDVKDWKDNAIYKYMGENQRIVLLWFWEVVEEFSNEDRLALFTFCTAQSKPPFAGFKYLTNGNYACRFTICFVADSQRLPVAHTCFNTLDLPAYPDKETLKNKLLLAIRSQANFDLD